VFARRLFIAAVILSLGYAVATRDQTAAGQDASRQDASRQDATVPVQQQPTLAKPPSQAAVNQRMADAIALRLQLSGTLRGYRVDIRYADGVAELSGRVADAGQRDEVVRIVKSLAGVEQVRDLLSMSKDGVVLTAQPPKLDLGPAPGPLGLGAQDKKAEVIHRRCRTRRTRP